MTFIEYNESLCKIQAKVADARNAGISKKEINDIKSEMEFDLSIEYFLGSDFSADRWEMLREIHRHMRRSLIMAVGLRVRGETSPAIHDTEVQSITKKMVKDFANILSTNELKSFIGGNAEFYSETSSHS